MKLAFDVPRNTFTYLVEGFLAFDMTSMRNQILSRYAGFYRKLLNSPSREVRGLARIISSDPRSTTCRNIILFIVIGTVIFFLIVKDVKTNLTRNWMYLAFI